MLSTAKKEPAYPSDISGPQKGRHIRRRLAKGAAPLTPKKPNPEER